MPHLRLRQVLPAFSDELEALLLRAGKGELASQVATLELVDRCRCNDSFCGTFYSVPPPKGAWGPGHYTIALSEAATGMINVDVLDGRIVEVEVLWRSDVRDTLTTAVP